VNFIIYKINECSLPTVRVSHAAELVTRDVSITCLRNESWCYCWSVLNDSSLDNQLIRQCRLFCWIVAV